MRRRLSIDEVTAKNRSRCRRWHPGFPRDEEWTIADWSNAMAGEAGEAANVVKKLRRIETGYGADGLDREALLEQLGEELADAFLYMDLLATKTGIDLPAAIVAKFNRVSEERGYPERLTLHPNVTVTIEADTGGYAKGLADGFAEGRRRGGR